MTMKRRSKLLVGVVLAALAGAAGLAFAVDNMDAAVPPAPVKQTVRIVVQTVPPVERATIRWGKKRLGEIQKKRPFVFDRPRDSGPLDLTIRAEGFLPVNTRAYTFSDTKLFVRLTRVTDKHTLFGYRQDVPDGGDETQTVPDAGAPR